MKFAGTIAALAVFSSGSQEPLVVFEEGKTLTVSEQVRSETRLETFRIVADEGVLAQMDTSASPPSIDTRVLHYSDHFARVEGGEPVEVQRQYLKLQRVEVKEETREATGVLEGKTIVLSLNEDGAVTARIDGEAHEGPVEQEFLEDHRLSYPVLRLLPEDVPEPETEWEIDEKLAFELLGLFGGPRFFEGEEPGQDRLEQLFSDTASCAGSARFEEAQAPGGRACWKITYHLTVEAKSDGFDPSLVGLPPPDDLRGTTMRLDGAGEGVLWIDRELRLPLERQFDLDAKLAFEMDQGPRRTEVEMVVTHEERQRWQPQ